MLNQDIDKFAREGKYRRILTTIDDKYRHDRIEDVPNTSTRWRRLSDLAKAAVSSIWRIRAIDKPTDGSDVKYRIMFLMNTDIKELDANGVATASGWGGWLTTAGGVGHDKTEEYPEHSPAPPAAYIAQLGSVFWLTDDDKDYITEDGDYYTYVNIRHDAHFHMDGDHDGRIYFTTTEPGARPDGYAIIGEMVHDPALINADTQLGKESGEWCPQINIPQEWIPQENYTIDQPVASAPITKLVAGDFDAGTYHDAVETLASKVNECVDALNSVGGF